MWDVDKAVRFLDAHASPVSLGHCAQYTREAIEAGGVRLFRHIYAKDYGSSLTAVGFLSLGQLASFYSAGDVGIVEPIPGHPAGHMAMFDGSYWVSDFKQLHGLYPGPSFRSQRPAYTIFRYALFASPSGAPPVIHLT